MGEPISQDPATVADHPAVPGNPHSAAPGLKDLAGSFRLLADETRLQVLQLLVEFEELNVRSLCDLLGQSQPSVSHHLGLLRTAGLVRARRDGKHNYYRTVPEKLESLIELARSNVVRRQTMVWSTE